MSDSIKEFASCTTRCMFLCPFSYSGCTMGPFMALSLPHPLTHTHTHTHTHTGRQCQEVHCGLHAANGKAQNLRTGHQLSDGCARQRETPHRSNSFPHSPDAGGVCGCSGRHLAGVGPRFPGARAQEKRAHTQPSEPTSSTAGLSRRTMIKRTI